METSQAQPNPDLIIVTMTKSVAEKTTMALSPLEYIEVQQDAVKWATAALAEAAATIASQKSAMAAMEAVNQQQSTKLREAMEVIAEQSRRIKLLEATPQPFEPVPPAPPVVPVDRLTPIITKTDMKKVRGYCITLGEEVPSATVDATAVKLIQLGAKMGFNTVRFYRNKDEVRADLKRTDEDPRHLYAVAKKHGLTVVADTINRAALEFSDTELSQYLAGLKSLGAVLLVFDDANQYSELRKDGTPYPPNTLRDMVGRVRKFSDLPMIASTRANAAVGEYKPLFDHLEIQCFGKAEELPGFLEREKAGVDAFVIPAESKTSLDYLRRIHDIILKYDPEATFDYSAWDENTLWLDMDDKVALIEKRVKAQNAARLIKVS